MVLWNGGRNTFVVVNRNYNGVHDLQLGKEAQAFLRKKERNMEWNRVEKNLLVVVNGKDN